MGEALITRRGGNIPDFANASLQHITTITLSKNSPSTTVTLPRKLSAYRVLTFDTFVTFTATEECGTNVNVMLDISEDKSFTVGNNLVMLAEGNNFPITSTYDDHRSIIPKFMEYDGDNDKYETGILLYDGSTSVLNYSDFFVPTADIYEKDTFQIRTSYTTEASGLSNVSISVVISGI